MRRVSRLTALATLLVLSSGGRYAPAQEAAPTDWPHLRGPNYDAVSAETGLVEAWPEGGPPVLWARELGQGYSGFVAVGGRVYTQFQTRTGQYVIALDADSGEEVWRRRVDWPWQPAGAYPGPYATPTWHGGRLYYATPAGLVGCLDADDGSTVWSAGDDPASYCPAYPVTANGRRLVIAFLRNSLVAHDLATGQRLWRQELSAEYDEHSAWPLYDEPHLLVAAPFRKGSRLFRLGGGEPREVWASRELSNDVCSGVLTGGHVFGFDLHQLQASPHRPSRGLFKCLDFATGKARWETDKVGQATVLAADSKLILLNETGTLVLARASPAAYEELARARVLDGGLCWTPPTPWHGRLFVRNHTRAACVYLGAPENLDPNRSRVRPTSGEPSFDWTRLLSREPDFPNDDPPPEELARWFRWCCAGVFGGSALVAGAAWLAARLGRSPRPKLWAGAAFVAVAFLTGLAGTTVFSAWADAFVLTWPASLYVAFRLTLGVVVWAEARPAKTRRRLVSRPVTLLFLSICYGYYRLCLEVGYVMAWGFLAGFLPAAPAAVVAARARNPWLRALADMAGFTVYFWASGLLPAAKGRWVG